MNSKREAILEMVLKYLTQADMHKPLTVANLAQDLDIGKSTIYEYFDHKEALIIEAIGLLVDKNVEILLAEDDLASLTFKQAFKSHMQRLHILAKDHEMLQNYTYHYEVAKLPKAKKQLLYERIYSAMDTVEKRLEIILEKGMGEGTIKPLRNPARLQTIKSLIFGAVASVCDPYNDWDAEALFEDIFEALILLHR